MPEHQLQTRKHDCCVCLLAAHLTLGGCNASIAASGLNTGSTTQNQRPVLCCTDQPASTTSSLSRRSTKPVMAVTRDGLRVNGCRGERGRCTSDACEPRARVNRPASANHNPSKESKPKNGNAMHRPDCSLQTCIRPKRMQVQCQ